MDRQLLKDIINATFEVDANFAFDKLIISNQLCDYMGKPVSCKVVFAQIDNVDGPVEFVYLEILDSEILNEACDAIVADFDSREKDCSFEEYCKEMGLELCL